MVLFDNNVLMLLLGISVALNVQQFEVDFKIVNSDGVLHIHYSYHTRRFVDLTTSQDVHKLFFFSNNLKHTSTEIRGP